MPYTLITVTYGGEVHHSRGYETLLMCQEARSVALTGRTIAEVEEQKRAWEEVKAVGRRREAEALEAWRSKTFPARHPTPNEAEKLRSGVLCWPSDDQTDRLFQRFDGVQEYYRVTACKLGADGLIHHEIRSQISFTPGVSTFGGGGSGWGAPVKEWEPPPGKIKHAVCVLEMPDSPSAPVAA